jgi:putative hydrolase of the HAD superfamily
LGVELRTVFLDAGGVLVYPNWTRISSTLEERGVRVTSSALAAAEPFAKRRLDSTSTVHSTTDARRGWMYFDFVLEAAGIPASDATKDALVELHAYHMQHNLWEYVPDRVPAALTALRGMGLQLVVVSNANGTLREHFRRLKLDTYFDCILDSCEEGVEKPDPRLFRIALQKSRAAAASTIHVGDLYEVDVVGARAAGLRGVLLDEGGLYTDADCPRVQSLDELGTQIASQTFG